MSCICKALRSRHRSGVSDLFQTILPALSKWTERNGSTPPAFFQICTENDLPKFTGVTAEARRTTVHRGEETLVLKSHFMSVLRYDVRGINPVKALKSMFNYFQILNCYIFVMNTLHQRDIVFFIPGTVKVKSSGIQVGDLIIVEKVCQRSFHPHLWTVLLSPDCPVSVSMTANNEGVVNVLLLREVERVSKDFVIFWSMPSPRLSNWT